jgi:hypothetical protein
MITLGLSQIEAGEASLIGAMPVTMIKVGKTYKDSCKLVQAPSDVTEHFEEGKAAAEVRRKSKKPPTLTFSIMDADPQLLADLVGGSITGGTTWGFDGTEVVANRAIRVKAEQGLWVDVPNADIHAVINAEYSEKGIFLLDVTVTPAAVTSRKPIFAYPKPSLEINPTSLSFGVNQDMATVETERATAISNFFIRPGDTWVSAQIESSEYEITINVSENESITPRSSYITIISEGQMGILLVSQEGAGD